MYPSFTNFGTILGSILYLKLAKKEDQKWYLIWNPQALADSCLVVSLASLLSSTPSPGSVLGGSLTSGGRAETPPPPFRQVFGGGKGFGVT